MCLWHHQQPTLNIIIPSFRRRGIRGGDLPKTLNINESFICRIWEGGSEYYSNLQTSDGLPVKVLDFGKHNHDSGPDYKNARIKIGDKTYNGDVEIHRDFKGWAEHSHKKDSAYNSVILQVVLWNKGEENKPALRKKRDLPTVILSDYLNTSIHNVWQDIITSPSPKFRLQCYDYKPTIEKQELLEFLQTLSIERLKLKCARINQRLRELSAETKGSHPANDSLKQSGLWKQALYEFTFEALGFSKNKEPMLKLASNIKLEKIEKLMFYPDVQALHAILYGSSGLLFDIRIKDKYIDKIKSVWNELKQKNQFAIMNNAEWKFFRLRPSNFPTLRIAYGSQLIIKILREELLKKIVMEFKQWSFEVKKCFKSLSDLMLPDEDPYWQEHYNFGKLSKTKNKLIGKDRINDIIINVIIPLTYSYAEVFKDDIIKSNVLKFYNEFKIKPSNSVLDIISEQLLNSKDIKINTPAAEQAAIQLYNFYCTRERCKECVVWKSLENKKGYDYQIIFY